MACLKKTKYDNNDYFDILLTWMGLDENLNVDQKIGILTRLLQDTLNYDNNLADIICRVIYNDIINNVEPGEGSFNENWTYTAVNTPAVETTTNTNLPDSDTENTKLVNTSLKSKLLAKDGLGNTAYELYSNIFRTEIMNRVVFGNIPKSGMFNDSVGNTSYVNSVLFQYKADLVNKIGELLGPKFSYALDENMSTKEITAVIKKVLNDVVNSDDYKLKPATEISELIQSAYMLEFFDDLLEKEAPYIQKTDNFKNNPESIGLNMYTWVGPSIKYNQSWTNREIVGIDEYTGSFLKMLCDYFPEYDANSKQDLVGKITYAGFNNAMSTVMEWVNTSSDVTQDIVNEVRKGDKCDWNKVIDAYLASGTNNKGLLAHKLMGIQRYIFGRNDGNNDEHQRVPEQFKAEFNNQIRNQARANYLVYRMEYTADGYELIAQPLKEQYYNAKQTDIRKAVAMQAYYFQNLGKYTLDSILEKYGITISDKNAADDSFTITFSAKNFPKREGMFANNSFVDDDFKIVLKHDGKCYQITSLQWGQNFWGPEKQSSVNAFDDEYIKNLVLDLGLMANMDGYKGVLDALGNLSGTNLSLAETFISPIVTLLVASTGKGTFKDTYNDGYYNLYAYNQNFKTAAEFKGIGEGVEELNVLKDGNNNNLPGFQLAKQVDDIHSMIEDFRNPSEQGLRSSIHPNGKELMNTSVFQDTNDLCTRGVIKRMFIRGDTKVLNVVMKAAQMNVPEVSHLAIVKDFYENFKTNDGVIIHQSGTLADKQSHYMPEIDLKKIYIEGESFYTRLKNILNGNSSRYNLKLVYDHIREVRGSKLKKQLHNIFSRYAKVLGTSIPSDDYDSILTAFFEVRRKLREQDSTGKYIWNIDNLREAFKRIGVDLNDNFDFVVWKDKSLDLNPSLFNNIALYLHPNDNYFKARMSAAKESDIKSLIKEGEIWSEYRDPSFKNIWKSLESVFNGNRAYYGDSTLWKDSVSGNIKLCRIFRKNSDDSRGEEVKITMNNIDELLPGTIAKENEKYEIVYNPIYEAYQVMNSIIAPQFTDLMLGDAAAYDVKASINNSQPFDYTEIYDDDSESFIPSDTALSFFSKVEAEQNNTMSKRAMLLGATRFAMPHTRVKVAVMDDIAAPTFNNSGINNNEIVHDGGGFENPVHAITENLLVGSASVGMNKKTIFGYVDPQVGVLRELKWATFAITNFARRNYDPNSGVNQEEMFRKTNNLPIKEGVDIDFNSIYNLDHQSDALFHTPIYKYDNETGQHSKLLGFKRDVEGWKATWQNVNNVGEVNGPSEDILVDISSLYGIDQAFGGAWIKTQNINGKLEYEEFLDSKILARIIRKYGLNDSYIGYVVNKSAIKVGGCNVNKAGIFSESNVNEDLNYFEMLQDYGGIQMNADHEIDLAEVTEMTQMISSIIQRGTEYKLVDQMYTDIGKVAIEALNSLSAANESDDPNELFRQIGKALFDTFDSGNKDTLGLAQAFLRRAKEALDSKTGKKVVIPLSAETITPAYLNTVAALIRKRGIKRKYAGFPGVQVPSYGIIKTYNFEDYTGLTYEEISNKIRPYVKSGVFSKISDAFTDMKLTQDFNSSKLLYINSADRETIQNIFTSSINYGSFNDFLAYLDAYYVNMGAIGDSLSVIDLSKVVDPVDYINWYNAGNRAKNRPGNPFIKRVSPYNIDFEDTIIIRNNQTGEISDPIVVNSVKIYDKIRNLQNHNDYTIYKWTIQPRELRQGYSTFQVNFETNIETVNGIVTRLVLETRSIYDLDASRASFYLQEILSAIKDGKSIDSIEDYEQKLVVINAVCYNECPPSWKTSSGVILTKDTIPEFLKLSISKLRKTCKNISKGKLDYNLSFGNHNVKFTLGNVHYNAAQIMIGMADAKALGLEKGDTIYTVKSQKAKFFVDKLTKKIPGIKQVQNELNRVDLNLNFDAVLTLSDGRTMLVIKDDGNLLNERIVNSNAYDEDTTGMVWYRGEEFCDGNGKTFKTIPELNYDVLIVDDLSRIFDLDNANQISLIQYNYNSKNQADVVTVARLTDDYVNDKFIEKTNVDGNIYEADRQSVINELANSQEDDLRKKIKKLADRQYQAFLAHLKYIGARIPTQAMQSFADVEVVGFTNSPTNECYMARAITWIAGSDYDIDKFYCMGYELLPNGTIGTASNLDRYFDPEWVLSLPIPDGKKFNVIAGNNQSGTIEYYGTPDQNDVVWYNPNETIEKNIERILKSGKHTVAYHVPEETFGDVLLVNYILGLNNYHEVATEEVMNRIKNLKLLYKYLNIHSQTKVSPRRREVALKNRSVRLLHNICSNISTEVDAQLPINMDEEKEAAKNNSVASEEIFFNPDQAIMKFKLQYQNMVGKSVIGSVAVSLKGYFAALKSFNQQVLYIVDYIKSGNIDLQTFFKQLNELTFESRNNDLITFGNIDFDPLLELLNSDKTLQKINVPLDFKNSQWIRKGIRDYIDTDGTFNFLKFITELDHLSNGEYFTQKDGKLFYKTVDVAMGLSGLLSAATDNAKELILAKLNATSEFVDLYSASLVEGESFNDIAKFMTSDAFNIVAKFTKSNIFVPDSRKYRLRDAIKFVLDKGNLATCPKGFFEYFVRENSTELFSNGLVLGNGSVMRFEDLQEKLMSGDKQVKNILISQMVSDLKRRLQENDTIDGKNLREWVLNKCRSEYNSLLTKEKSSGQNINSEDIDDYAEQMEAQAEAEENEGYESSDIDETDLRAALNVNDKWLNSKDIKAKDWRLFYTYLTESLYIKNELLDLLKEKGTYDSAVASLETLDTLLDKAEELKMEGTLGSINQGTKNNFADESAWVDKINTFINKRYADKQLYTVFESDSNGVIQVTKQTFVPFDIIKFVDPKEIEYRRRQIEQYEAVKSSINILKSMTDTEHFNAMLSFVKLNRNLIERAAVNQISHKMAKEALLTPSDKDKHDASNPISPTDIKYLSAKAMKTVRGFARDTLIMNWFFRWAAQKGLKITIPAGCMYINSSGNNVKLNNSSTDIDFSVAANMDERSIANFLQLMDFYILPQLRLLANSSNFQVNGKPNAFLSSLILDAKRNNSTHVLEPFTRLANKTTGLEDISEIYKYDQMLNGFKKIWRMNVDDALGTPGLCNLTIGDAFFLYNLFVNKDGFGKNSWTRMFEDMITANYDFDALNSYYEYLYNLDSKTIKWLIKDKDGNEIIDKNLINYDINNLRVRLALTDEGESYKVGSKVKTAIIKNKVTINGVKVDGINFDYAVQNIPGYYPFKFGANSSFKGLAKTIGILGLTHNDSHLVVEQVINTAVNNLQKITGNKFNIQTFDPSNYELAKSLGINTSDLSTIDGFVDKGIIYINKDIASTRKATGVLIHELSHLIAAGMKYSSDNSIRQIYYSLLEKIKVESNKDGSTWNTIKTSLSRSKVYDYKTESDLMEEILIRGIEGYVTGNSYFTDEMENLKSEDLVQVLINIFDLKHGKQLNRYDISKIGASDIATIFEVFKSALQNNDVNSDFVVRTKLNQKENKLKELLLRKLGDNIELVNC